MFSVQVYSFTFHLVGIEFRKCLAMKCDSACDSFLRCRRWPSIADVACDDVAQADSGVLGAQSREETKLCTSDRETRADVETTESAENSLISGEEVKVSRGGGWVLDKRGLLLPIRTRVGDLWVWIR